VVKDKEIVWRHKVDPTYPRFAEKQGIEGRVRTLIDIDENGMPSNVVIVESTPKRIFDEATRKAILSSTFESHGSRYQAEVEYVYKLPH
jgi:TonB family protein